MTLLTGTDLKVTPLALGTAGFGSSRTDEEAQLQMDVYADLGGNFIDTAHVYGDWANRGPGLSERIIGRWLKGRRHNMIISSKGAHPILSEFAVSRLDKKSIMSDLDSSLSCLQTDYIDLYFLHRDDSTRSAEEILTTLEEARSQGKIRYYGCSNWSLDRIKEAEEISKAKGFSGFICNQLMWSLADINKSGVGDTTLDFMDRDTYEYHSEKSLSAMAYTSIANGYFQKLWEKASVYDGSRQKYDSPSNAAIYDFISANMPEGYNMLDLSLLYFQNQPFPAIPIAGFSSRTQLEEAMAAVEKAYPTELFDEVAKLKKFLN